MLVWSVDCLVRSRYERLAHDWDFICPEETHALLPWSNIIRRHGGILCFDVLGTGGRVSATFALLIDLKIRIKMQGLGI